MRGWVPGGVGGGGVSVMELFCKTSALKISTPQATYSVTSVWITGRSHRKRRVCVGKEMGGGVPGV